MRVLFAADHNPEIETMKQMMKARKRVDFAIFTFSKSSGIDDTMMRLLEMTPPMTIRGVFGGRQGAQDWAAIPNLKAGGADLHAVFPGGELGKLHHKLMVLDEKVVIAGPFNYTGPANRINDENIIILGDLDATTKTQRKAQKKIAKFAKAEIDRIVLEHGRPI